MIPPTYLVEMTSMKPPTISVDTTIAKQHVADTKQDPPTLHIPQQRDADTTTGGNAKVREAAQGGDDSNWEGKWDSPEYNEVDGDTTEGS